MGSNARRSSGAWVAVCRLSTEQVQVPWYRRQCGCERAPPFRVSTRRGCWSSHETLALVSGTGAHPARINCGTYMAGMIPSAHNAICRMRTSRFHSCQLLFWGRRFATPGLLLTLMITSQPLISGDDMRIANARGGMKLLFRGVGQRCRLCVAHLAVPASKSQGNLRPRLRRLRKEAQQKYV